MKRFVKLMVIARRGPVFRAGKREFRGRAAESVRERPYWDAVAAKTLAVKTVERTPAAKVSARLDGDYR